MKALYVVGPAFGLVPEGTIIACYLIAQENERALIYHPARTAYRSPEGEECEDDGSGSVEICKKNDRGIWESLHENSYVNLVSIDKKVKSTFNSIDKLFSTGDWRNEHQLAGVVCHWHFDENEKYPNIWKLEESYSIDEDGYDISKFAGSNNRYREWLYKQGRNDPVEIMGRAVTMWHFSSGVRLVGWNPKKFIKGVSPSFYESLYKGREWSQILADGHVAYLKTLDEVKKYL